MTVPTLHLMVGLPCTGKTTLARALERDHRALRLTKDEWVKALYGDDNPPEASDVIEGLLVDIGLRALELGIDVVIDFGLWARDERTALRQAARDRGVGVRLHYCQADPADQRRRRDERYARAPGTTWPMSDEELTLWAAGFEEPTPAEVADADVLEAAPPGFADWDAWRAWRWPARRSDTADTARGHDGGAAGGGE